MTSYANLPEDIRKERLLKASTLWTFESAHRKNMKFMVNFMENLHFFQTIEEIPAWFAKRGYTAKVNGISDNAYPWGIKWVSIVVE